MAYYRCNFLTSDGKVFCAEDLNGDTDDHALEKVRRICDGLEHTPSFELWRGSVLIYSEAGKAKAS